MLWWPASIVFDAVTWRSRIDTAQNDPDARFIIPYSTHRRQWRRDRSYKTVGYALSRKGTEDGNDGMCPMIWQKEITKMAESNPQANNSVLSRSESEENITAQNTLKTKQMATKEIYTVLAVSLYDIVKRI